MVIATGHSQATFDSYMRTREVVLNKTPWSAADTILLTPGSEYKFETINDVKSTFHLFFVLDNPVPVEIDIKSDSLTKRKTITPNVLFAPFDMFIFKDESEVSGKKVSLVTNEEHGSAVTIRVLTVPVVSSSLQIIISCKFIKASENMLILYETADLGNVTYDQGMLQVSSPCSIVFSEYMPISKLRVFCSRHNNIQLLSGNTNVDPLAAAVAYSEADTYIELNYSDNGVHNNVYHIRINKTATSARAIQVLASDNSSQIVLEDELGQRARDSVVNSVSASDANIVNWFSTDGILWITIELSTTETSIDVSISLQTHTGFQTIVATLNMETLYPTANFQAVNLVESTGKVYQLSVKDACLVLFHNGQEVFPSKIHVGNITLKGESDLILDCGNGREPVLHSSVITLDTVDQALEFGRTRIVFCDNNRVRIDQRTDGLWTRGSDLYINDHIETPLNIVGHDENSIRIVDGEIQFFGTGAIQVLDSTA